MGPALVGVRGMLLAAVVSAITQDDAQCLAKGGAAEECASNWHGDAMLQARAALLGQASKVVEEHDHVVEDPAAKPGKPPLIKVTPPEGPPEAKAEAPNQATKHHHIVDPDGEESLTDEGDHADEGDNAELLHANAALSGNASHTPTIRITPPATGGKFTLIQRGSAGSYYWSGYEKIEISVDTTGASIWVGIAGDFPESLTVGATFGIRLWYRLYVTWQGETTKLLHDYKGCTVTVGTAIECHGVPWNYILPPNTEVHKFFGLANFGIDLKENKDLYVKACTTLSLKRRRANNLMLIPFCAGLPDYVYLANFS